MTARRYQTGADQEPKPETTIRTQLPMSCGVQLVGGWRLPSGVVGGFEFLKGSKPNPGLLLQRYLPLHDRLRFEHGRSFQESPTGLRVSQTEGGHKGKWDQATGDWSGRGVLEWLAETGNQALQRKTYLHQAAHRRRCVLTQLGFARSTYRTRSRFVPGSANPSPAQGGGLAWHWTYGFPMLPAPSLRGVVRHYLAEEKEDEARATELFGEGGDDGAPGTVTFADAWPNLESEGAWPKELLEVDVLAPHGQGEPIPVHFLCVPIRVEFCIYTRVRGEDSGSDKQLTELQELVTEALDHWGAGAATGSGYGRFRHEEKGGCDD